jgi:hypothetical protein
MVKYARRGYRARKLSRRQFNYIASTYMKYKVAVNFQATWSGTNSPYISFGTNYGQTVNSEQIFGNTGNEYLTLRGYYSYYKLTGALIEVTPTKAEGTNGEFKVGGSAVLGLVQSGETMTYNTLSQSPQAIGLDVNNKTRKYIPLRGSWTPTNLIANSAIKMAVSSNAGIASGSVYYNIRLVLYLTFKNPI